MERPSKRLLGLIMAWAPSLKFPRLLMLTAFLFGLDLLVPDLIPVADEVLLGLATLLLASLKEHRAESRADSEVPTEASPE